LRVLLGGVARRAGEEYADAADFDAVLVERDAAGQGRDPARLCIEQDSRDLPVRFWGDQVRSRGDVLRGDVEPGPGDLAETITVGALDAEKVDLGREHDPRWKMPLDPHRRDEPRPVQGR